MRTRAEETPICVEWLSFKTRRSAVYSVAGLVFVGWAAQERGMVRRGQTEIGVQEGKVAGFL